MSDNHCENAMQMHDSCFCLDMLKIDSGGRSWIYFESGRIIVAVRAKRLFIILWNEFGKPPIKKAAVNLLCYDPFPE